MALNAFTLVLYVDPTSPEGLVLADMCKGLFEQYYPIRFGECKAHQCPKIQRLVRPSFCQGGPRPALVSVLIWPVRDMSDA